MNRQKREYPSRGGYAYHPTEEMMQTFSRLSAEQKLTWLADANSFLFAVASDRTKKTWQRLRNGETL